MERETPMRREACRLPLHWPAHHQRASSFLPRPSAIPSDMPQLNGMDSATSALRYWERKQEVVANNLANVSTDGFKAQRVFARLLDGMRPEAETQSDLSTGN